MVDIRTQHLSYYQVKKLADCLLKFREKQLTDFQARLGATPVWSGSLQLLVSRVDKALQKYDGFVAVLAKTRMEVLQRARARIQAVKEVNGLV